MWACVVDVSVGAGGALGGVALGWIQNVLTAEALGGVAVAMAAVGAAGRAFGRAKALGGRSTARVSVGASVMASVGQGDSF